ncbi:unnamed protein product [Dracunculus medinensis]|uniref:Secreted protein n=1 Tax=Dracunculus medinensis TaxID=318479 RepID=A0A0N4UDP8_DRAME|nr:unnamed protein product [Dracunculus medinensis]
MRSSVSLRRVGWTGYGVSGWLWSTGISLVAGGRVFKWCLWYVELVGCVQRDEHFVGWFGMVSNLYISIVVPSIHLCGNVSRKLRCTVAVFLRWYDFFVFDLFSCNL